MRHDIIFIILILRYTNMRKGMIALMLVLAVFILAACAEELPPADTTPTAPAEVFDISQVAFTKTKVLFHESGSSREGLAGFGLNKDLETATLEGVTYGFDPAIRMEERTACIETTQAILAALDTGKTVSINIYNPNTYDQTFSRNGAVFIPAQDWTTPEYITSVLLGLFGDYCNYGAVLGYANYLCQQLYGVPADLCGQDFAYTGTPNALDLNILCFRPEFVTKAEIESAHRLANTFVAQYIQKNGAVAFHRLLESSGDPAQVSVFCDALAAFYRSMGIEHTPSPILYRMGGRTYNYIVKCDYAIMYIEKTWTDLNKDLCPLTYDNFLHENYADVRHYFTTSATEMGQYQDLFGLTSYNNDLHIYFNNHTGTYSHYIESIHSIVLHNTASLSHEYIHSLTANTNIRELWAHEGFAYWFDSYYNLYGNAMSTVDYNTVTYPYVVEFREQLGRDFDMSVDFTELWHVTTYAHSIDDPNDSKGYAGGASFIGYLISRFGEEKVIEIICRTHDFGEYTYEELVADWQVFIQENYSGYTKRKS